MISVQTVAGNLEMIQTLPVSMSGNPILYVTTLTAMMCGTLLGAYVFGWMISDMVRDRKFVDYKTVLFNFRLMMALCGITGFFACLPEVLYLQMYGDPQVSVSAQHTIMIGKRIADSTRIYFIMSWVAVFSMIYPYITVALIERQEDAVKVIRHLQVTDYPAIRRLIKPASIFVLLTLIALAFAVSKVYQL